VSFSQFSSDLDKATLAQLARGQRLRELLKQPQNTPKSVEDQVALIYAGTNGYLDVLPVSLVTAFVANLQEYLAVKDNRFIAAVKSSKKIDADAEAILKEAIAKVKKELSIS
jgi:F-type H+-transporting ATPase subunit alpha